MIGRALTLKYEPVGVDKGNVGDFIDDIDPGTIIVIDNAGRLNCTVWGDILTTMASMKGIGGTVIDGVCRDTSLYSEISYPVFSKGRYMRTGKDRVQLEAINVPVSLSGVRVRPNDIILGDTDGVVVIPAEYEERVLEISLEIEEAESQIRTAIKSGMRLDEARKTFKYHSLQTKRGV